MLPASMPRPFPPDNSEVESRPIVPVNCDSCQVRKDQEAELSRYRAFVDELKAYTAEAGTIGDMRLQKLLRKHNLGEQE